MEFKNNTFVVVLVARNEEKHIQKTIDSIVKQTCIPKVFEIVLNDCTDKTEEIVKDFCKKHFWIHYSYFHSPLKRNYSNKANAVNTAYRQLSTMEFDFIGILDADIVLPPDYYASIITKFHENSNLGIAGGHFYDVVNGKICMNCEFYEISVPGSVQLFRRKCFEEINGYIPVSTGGEDMIAEIYARYKGWQTRAFPDIIYLNNRPLGTANSSIYMAKFSEGIRDCAVGYSTIYYIAKCVRRLKEKPIIIGSFLRLAAFIYSSFIYRKKVLDNSVRKFFIAEQLNRLKSTIFHTRSLRG